MFHRKSTFPRFAIVALLLAVSVCASPPKTKAQSPKQSVDIFLGLDLNFRDIHFDTQYDFLIRLAPGFKWNMGNHWQLSGQVMFPILNQYGVEYGFFQVRELNVSKEFKIKSLYLKATAGAFSHNRYGLDLKAFLPLCDWFAFEGHAGFVGSVFVSPYWEIVAPNRFVGTLGGDIYLTRWNTQLRGVVGKYLYDDIGLEGEAMRHFNHTTVSVYGRWSNKYGLDAGFRVVIMLPPYHRKQRVVNFRPASNWRMSYSMMVREYSHQMYRTDPEENERDGWFSRDLLQWGSHTMEPDFIITEKTKKNETP